MGLSAQLGTVAGPCYSQQVGVAVAVGLTFAAGRLVAAPGSAACVHTVQQWLAVQREVLLLVVG